MNEIKETLLNDLKSVNSDETFDCVKFTFQNFDQGSSCNQIMITSYEGEQMNALVDTKLCILLAETIRRYYENSV